MTIESTILKIKRELISTFALLDEWFDESEHFLMYRPPGGGWSPHEILEHVMITSHYLLILIDKGSEKARRKAAEVVLEAELKNYVFENARLDEIGIPGTFNWNRPDHMVPTGAKGVLEVRDEIRDQLNRCLCHLELLRNGEGILHTTTMTVNELGRLDVYQYIYFLARHARRHVKQLQDIRAAYAENLLSDSLSTC